MDKCTICVAVCMHVKCWSRLDNNDCAYYKWFSLIQSHVNAHKFVHTQSTHACSYTHLHTLTHAHIHTYTIHIIYMCIHIYIRTNKYMYIHTHTQTHMHIRTQTNFIILCSTFITFDELCISHLQINVTISAKTLHARW